LEKGTSNGYVGDRSMERKVGEKNKKEGGRREEHGKDI